jgi:membrane protease YdiL (CAAX protease family)
MDITLEGNALGLGYWFFVAGTLLFVGALGASTWATARLLRTWRPPFNPLLQPADLLLRVLLVGLCVLLGWFSGLPAATLGWQLPNAGAQIVLGVAIGLLLALAIYLSTRILVARTGYRHYSPLLVELLAPRTRAELALIALALIPTVLLEELLFRSLWIGGLSPLLPPPLLILAGALLFGAMHSPQGAWGMAGAALAGLLFGALFWAAGSLLLPLVAHYVANLAQLAAAPWIFKQEQL